MLSAQSIEKNIGIVRSANSEYIYIDLFNVPGQRHPEVEGMVKACHLGETPAKQQTTV